MVNGYFLSGNMESLDLKENIEELAKSGKTYKTISNELKDQSSDWCGVSSRSEQKFCRDHQTDKKSLLEKEKLDSFVKEKVLQVIVYVFTFVKW